MDFKEQISKHGTNQGWNIKMLSDSIVLKSKRGEMTISWRGIKPDRFHVSTTLSHPKMGNTTLKRKDLTLVDVLKLITEPRSHTGKGVYQSNGRLDAKRKHLVQKGKKVITYDEIVRKRDKKRYKVTGRMALYKEIWKERPHKSEISDEPLIENQHHPLWRNQFMHILPHSQYKNYEFRKENIILGTHQEHDLQTTNVGKCMEDPKWDHFFARFAALREDYERELKAGNFKYNKL